MSKPEIIERENGPLVVKNLKTMVGTDGENIDVKEVMALCRCGQSKNKPFCDGSHTAAGFESRGGTPEGRDRLIAYEGSEITVQFNPRLCSHAAECNRLHANIFDATKRPWIMPDEGTVDQIKDVVAACPSGALTIATQQGNPSHIIANRANISVQKDGPYWVTGPTPPNLSAGEGASPEKYVLCRCGLSGNKPYCDGSHRSAGWKDGK